MKTQFIEGELIRAEREGEIFASINDHVTIAEESHQVFGKNYVLDSNNPDNDLLKIRIWKNPARDKK